jgi:F-type H+-transporting ATPase subunit a
MIVLLATLLLAQAQPEHAREPVSVPETAHSAAEHGEGEHAKGGGEHKGGVAEHIFEHVQDEVVVPLGFWVGHRWYVHLDITKHVINMWIAAGILLIVVGLATRKRALVPKGGYNMLETFVLFVRDEISVKNIGHHAAEYTPYLCSAFFFILFMNLEGLLPFPAWHGFPGISTATGNVNVTVVLALFTFVLTQIAGMRAQGVIGYWAHLVPSGVPKALWPLMFVIEFFGLFTKPFALTVRLFANMVAGHIVIFFLIALTLFISVYVAPVSVAFALGIFLLELFVALVQAYVFTILSALFIGMTQHAH